MVGLAGFEPATPASRTQCATKLRYNPLVGTAGFEPTTARPPAESSTKLSHVPIRTHTGSRTPISGFVGLRLVRWTMWVWCRRVELNHRSPRYQRGALTWLGHDDVAKGEGFERVPRGPDRTRTDHLRFARAVLYLMS